MAFRRDRPYNHLPPLPPDTELETAAVLKAAIPANRLLAELKGKCENLPNPEILLNTIILQEAKASSEIENVITTNDKLFTALTAGDKAIDPHTKEVLRYREALRKGVRTLENHPFDADFFIEIMQTLKQTEEGIRNSPGTVIGNPITKEIIYWPPESEGLILNLLKNLEEYIYLKDGTDPLVRMAVIHYQFEAIHPFSDGNGRTGRILNILYLIHEELLLQPVLYLSEAIISRKTDYYRLLRGVTEEGAWEPWILFILEGVQETAEKTMQQIDAIRDLMQETITRTREELPDRVYSKELIELLFEQPYCKTATLVERGIAKRQTAAEYLRELEKTGILQRKQVGRENLYLNVRLLDLLSNT